MSRGEPLACNLFTRGVFAVGREGVLKDIVRGRYLDSCRGSSTALCFSLVVVGFFLNNKKMQVLVGFLTGGLPNPRDLFWLGLYPFSA